MVIDNRQGGLGEDLVEKYPFAQFLRAVAEHFKELVVGFDESAVFVENDPFPGGLCQGLVFFLAVMQLPGQGIVLQRLVDGLNQQFMIDRFAEKIVGPLLHCLDGGLDMSGNSTSSRARSNSFS